MCDVLVLSALVVSVTRDGADSPAGLSAFGSVAQEKKDKSTKSTKDKEKKSSSSKSGSKSSSPVAVLSMGDS